MESSSKKIAFVINVDWYFKLHWIERADYFKSLGYSIHVISSFQDENIKSYLLSRGYYCHDFIIKRKSVNPFRELTSIAYLYRLIKKIDPDLIHSVTIKPNIYAGLLNLVLINKPIVFGITGLGAVFSSSTYKFVCIKHIVSACYKLISDSRTHFIFENGDDFALFKRLGVIKNDNGTLIKGAGIDLNRFKPTNLLATDSVLFAARLLEEKGLACLIEAKRILQKQGFNFTLNVAGIIDNDVSNAIPFSQIEDWDRNGDINWLGSVIDMPNLISNNAIICLPTTYGEGVPRILIEAAACQRAIVATNVSGCREIVSHGYNGYLVEPNSPELLADYLKLLLEDNLKLVSFGENGRYKVESEFSQEIVFEKTQRVYRQLLGL